MTLAELAEYNGRDGRRAYIAVNGTVYDVTDSPRWENGLHPPDHQAGKDLTEELAKANVEGIVTELAYLFDEGEIAIGGKTYRPRLAFVDEAGNVLPGVAELVTLHQLAEDPFEIDPDAGITFEEPEFDEG